MPLHLRAHMHVFCACTHDSACAAVCTRVHPCIKEEVQSCTHVFSSLQTALHVGGLLLYVHLLSASITADMDYFVTNTNNQKSIPPGRRKCMDGRTFNAPCGKASDNSNDFIWLHRGARPARPPRGRCYVLLASGNEGRFSLCYSLQA